MSRLVLFGRENCGVCKQTKSLLESVGISFTYHDFDYFMGNGFSKDAKITVRAALAFANEEFPVAVQQVESEGDEFSVGDEWLNKNDLMAMGGEKHQAICDGGSCRL